MIIENPPAPTSPRLSKKDYFKNGVILDTCVLLVFLIDKYVKINPNKNYLLRKVNITERQVSCLNSIITNFRISKIIITPHILSEFLNKIRNVLKEDYKNLKKECLRDLENFGEIHIKKDNLIKHDNFIEFGNDISLVLANEKQMKNFKHSCIMSFDGRFIEKFFRKTKSEVLAFNLETLQYFY